MKVKPDRSEAEPYYFKYIDRVQDGDVIAYLSRQLETTFPLFDKVNEDTSRFRYDPPKWSIRQVINHVADTERAFLFRALWFARGLEGHLPSFEQDIAAANSGADGCAWSLLVEELRLVRMATTAFFSNLPSVAWDRSGIASGKRFTVRAIAFIVAGHLDHHAAVLAERYMP